MCLLVLAWNAHPRFRLIVAANRDEFHDRPAQGLHAWPAPLPILAGRDLRAGGTWLGLDRARRFGVITNFRDRQPPLPGAPSRGELIPAYLGSREDPQAFFSALEPRGTAYSGFNLLLADSRSLWYGSNRAQPFSRALTPGVYGLSNGLLDTPWPKLLRVRAAFAAWLAAGSDEPQGLFALLGDRNRVSADHELPRTGVPREWERVLSAPFVLDPTYGTRASTVLLLGHDGHAFLAERRFDAAGNPAESHEFDLAPGAWA